MEKEIFIQNKYGEKLSGIIEDRGKKEVIIICHGSRGNKEEGIQRHLSKNLIDYNTFRFDFSGSGNSEGKLEDATYSKEIDDLISVLKYFKEKGKKIKSVIGYSKSGTEVLIAADKISLFSESIISLSPRINLFESQEMKSLEKNKEFFNKKGYYNYSLNHKITKNYISNIKELKNWENEFNTNVPVAIFHGEEDKTINFQKSKKFASKNNIFFKKIPEANHIYSGKEDKNKLIEEILTWLSNI